MVVQILIAFCMAACTSDEDPAGGKRQDVQTLRIAVLMQEGERARWESTASAALENMRKAQTDLPSRVELELDFYDQDAADIDVRVREMVEDRSIAAIIGPTTSDCAMRVGSIISTAGRTDLPMITPCATDVEYQRRFSKSPFVWNLAESDITELEVIISRIAGMEDVSTVFLLTGNDSSGTGIGNAYEEWFGFIAGEYSLKVGDICLYDTEEDVRAFARRICGYDWRMENNVLVFNPSDESIALAFDDEIGKIKSETPRGGYFYAPHIYCSDAFVSDHIAASAAYGTYEGVDLYVMPESGFHQAYKRFTGEDLINGQGQFYDALHMVAYAATLSGTTGKNLNDAMLSVVEGRECPGGGWLPEDMRQNFRMLRDGICPDIDGVSGTWTFDEKTHSCVVGSTYRHWRLNDGKFVTLEYVGVNSSGHTSSSKNMWDWTASRIETPGGEEGAGMSYPPLGARWALLVAGSSGWANYRFQADVFAAYSLLRQSGYDDEHIVMVVADDIADNPKNPFPGVVRVSDDGDNLYVPSAIDYRLDSLTPEDIGEILQGRASDRLPHVIEATASDNILIFWSGHGSPGSLDFGGNRQLTHRMMREILSGTPHRKILFAVEACFSGGLGERCSGLPGILFITAALPYETSHADVWSEATGVYLSNGFTRGFMKSVTGNKSVSLRDLYYDLAETTAGSHVKIYNTAAYGSVYDNTMADYLE